MTEQPKPKAHPQRCETCEHHTENMYMDFCHGYPMSKDDPTEILIHISKFGCASHSSSAQQRCKPLQLKNHPKACELVKTLYDYAVEQFTSAEDDSDLERAFVKMLDLFPQTQFARTQIWNDPCASHSSSAQQRIDAAIIELRRLSKAKWDAAERTKNITFSYEGIGVDEAIALLQAGEQHE